MENIELLFPSNLNIEAADKCGSLLANFAFGDFHTLKCILIKTFLNG